MLDYAAHDAHFLIHIAQQLLLKSCEEKHWIEIEKRAREILFVPRSMRDPLLESFGFFKKNVDFFDPNSDDYLYTLFICE